MANDHKQSTVTRRDVLRWGAAAATLSTPAARTLLAAQPPRGAAHQRTVLHAGWTLAPADGGTAAEPITLPHVALKLSWESWDPASWAKLYNYKTSFASPVAAGSSERVFLHFDGVMSGAQPIVNGHTLDKHLGGFLPFEYEITSMLQPQNDLTVVADGHWLNVPPSGSPKGPQQVDYLMPPAIHRDVVLKVVPQNFIEDVFAKPVNVLDPAARAVELECMINAGAVTAGSTRVNAVLMDGATEVAHASAVASVNAPGKSVVRFKLTGLNSVGLWSPDDPKLYTVKVSLMSGGAVMHEYTTRIGFREAVFKVDGFFLNGKKSKLFGLNRHELFPYVGFAMPERVLRHDAEMLKHEMHVNTVRCSHYPQSPAFLDACDELGLMVWEEIPGWQYIGDDAWKELLLRDIRSMVIRDRNRPSVIIWGVRVNESHNDPPLYAKTTALAKELDGSRQCSGTMTTQKMEGWAEDVFVYDDYHNGPDGKLAMHKPNAGVPFFFGEAIGQFGYEHGGEFRQFYRRAGERDVVEGQAKWHCQGQDRGNDDPRCGGVIAWCMFDYASLLNGFKAIKCPGVVDTFRVPKLGATFYQSQVSPSVKPVILPSFFWDFTKGNPGKEAYIFSNCDSLKVSFGEKSMTLMPDKKGYPNTAYPPFIVDLSKGKAGDELTIEGFVNGQSMLTKKMSSDRSTDKLVAGMDDAAIRNDGVDATRVWFQVVDACGAQTQCMDGEVTVGFTGPGEMVGDTSFAMAETGGTGAVWMRAKPGMSGTLNIHMSHPRYGSQTVKVETKASV